MSGAIPPLRNTPLWRSSQLKHRDFTFTFTSVTQGTGGGEKITITTYRYRKYTEAYNKNQDFISLYTL